jgi:hypothetical protein
MSDAGNLMGRSLGHHFGNPTTPILDMWKIEVAPHYERGRSDLAETAEGGSEVEVRPDCRRPERDAIHVEEQLARLASDSFFTRERPIQPQMRFDSVHLIQIAQVFDGPLSRQHFLDLRRVHRFRRATYTGRDKHQTGNLRGMLESGIDRDFASLRTSHEYRGLVLGDSIDDRHQVRNGREILFRRLRFTKAPPVVGNGHIVGPNGLQLPMPHSAVTYIRMQENHRTAFADDLGRQQGATGRNLDLGMQLPPLRLPEGRHYHAVRRNDAIS